MFFPSDSIVFRFFPSNSPSNHLFTLFSIISAGVGGSITLTFKILSLEFLSFFSLKTPFISWNFSPHLDQPSPISSVL